jgi:hypothetical protein
LSIKAREIWFNVDCRWKARRWDSSISWARAGFEFCLAFLDALDVQVGFRGGKSDTSNREALLSGRLTWTQESLSLLSRPMSM